MKGMIIEMKKKAKKLINSFKYAGEGIINSFKTERNMKIHVFIMICVILLGFFLKISQIEWIICILLFILVLTGELFNTAIETVVDMIMPHKNEKAKLAKDIAAGGVLILAIGAAVIGFFIFLPKIMIYLQ